MAKAKTQTPGRIGRATLEKITEVQLDFNEKITTIQVTLGNLIQQRQEREEREALITVRKEPQLRLGLIAVQWAAMVGRIQEAWEWLMEEAAESEKMDC